ncbi:MAG: nuclear transport factor 2 family protein [Bacteroidota bacterium]
MKKQLLLFGITIILFSTKLYSQIDKNLPSTIEKIMHQQELAWNKGDIDGFMTAYWNNDSLKFIGKNGITYGWQNTLNNYKKNYPDQEAMGVLTFEIKSIEQLSDSTFYVIGSWNLNKKKGSVGGYYTLLWKKIKGQWVIVSDHTS